MQLKIDTDSYYAEIGQLIKGKREKARKSQEQLAKYLGFESRISIANIETGRQKIHVHTLAEIASYLKVPIEELLPPLDIHKKESTINPELAKNLNKEGINPMASEELKALISKIDSLKPTS